MKNEQNAKAAEEARLKDIEINKNRRIAAEQEKLIGDAQP